LQLLITKKTDAFRDWITSLEVKMRVSVALLVTTVLDLSSLQC